MNKHKRHEIILKRLKKEGSITSRDLLYSIPVSMETLRKDLKHLETAGVLLRLHGKVVFSDNRHNDQYLQKSGILNPEERREKIKQFLKTKRKYRISNIPKHFSVSLSTIQKDLQMLEDEGLVEKKHGYVIYMERLSYPVMQDEIPRAVKLVGDMAISHIDEKTSIFLDGSLFSQYIASNVRGSSEVSVVTSSLDILHILSDRDYQHPVTVPSGTLNTQFRNIAPDYQDQFFQEKLSDTSFFCFSSFHDNTFYAEDEQAFQLLKKMCELSDRTYCFLNSKNIGSKIGAGISLSVLYENIEAIIVDDGIEIDRAYEIFPLDLPIIITGEDYTHHYISNKNYKIGFSLVSRDNYFIRTVRNSIEEAAKKVHNISLITRKAKDELSITTRNMKWFIQEKIDLLVDYSLDFESSLYVAEKCRASGIKVLSIDNHIPNSVYYGAMNYEAGKIAGEKAAEGILDRWKGKLDTIIVIKNETADPLNDLRISSTVETVKNSLVIHPERIFTIRWANSLEDAKASLEHLLVKEAPEHKCLIIQFNNLTMLESHDTIRKHREKEHTMVVCHNYSPQIEILMNQDNSTIFGSVCYSPDMYGSDVIDLAVRMLRGEKVGNINYTKHRWIPNPNY